MNLDSTQISQVSNNEFENIKENKIDAIKKIITNNFNCNFMKNNNMLENIDVIKILKNNAGMKDLKNILNGKINNSPPIQIESEKIDNKDLGIMKTLKMLRINNDKITQPFSKNAEKKNLKQEVSNVNIKRDISVNVIKRASKDKITSDQSSYKNTIHKNINHKITNNFDFLNASNSEISDVLGKGGLKILTKRKSSTPIKYRSGEKNIFQDEDKKRNSFIIRNFMVDLKNKKIMHSNRIEKINQDPSDTSHNMSFNLFNQAKMKKNVLDKCENNFLNICDHVSKNLDFDYEISQVKKNIDDSNLPNKGKNHLNKNRNKVENCIKNENVLCEKNIFQNFNEADKKPINKIKVEKCQSLFDSSSSFEKNKEIIVVKDKIKYDKEKSLDNNSFIKNITDIKYSPIKEIRKKSININDEKNKLSLAPYTQSSINNPQRSNKEDLKENSPFRDKSIPQHFKDQSNNKFTFESLLEESKYSEVKSYKNRQNKTNFALEKKTNSHSRNNTLNDYIEKSIKLSLSAQKNENQSKKNENLNEREEEYTPLNVNKKQTIINLSLKKADQKNQLMEKNDELTYNQKIQESNNQKERKSLKILESIPLSKVNISLI